MKRTEEKADKEIWLMLLKSFYRSATAFLRAVKRAIMLMEREEM